MTTVLREKRDAAALRRVGLWDILSAEAARVAGDEPALAGLIEKSVARYGGLAEALSALLGVKLAGYGLDSDKLRRLVADAIADDPAILEAASEDLIAVRDRDPACPDHVSPFLFFKGFQALQAHRTAHWYWARGRQHLALALQSRGSEVFGVDIHPAAQVGRRILIDHGTGIVVGETAVIEDDVSILQGVTLGGTGKVHGDRHPKIRRGVLIGAGAKVLGNIEIGEGAKIGAGSIVLEAVHPYTTVVGNPARALGVRHKGMPALTMDQTLPPVDYVI
jgi:serine O-acetyltransferase